MAPKNIGYVIGISALGSGKSRGKAERMEIGKVGVCGMWFTEAPLFSTGWRILARELKTIPQMQVRYGSKNEAGNSAMQC